MAASLDLASPGDRVESVADLLARFDPDRLPRDPWRFDPDHVG
jgi:hypothetical protein